MKIYLEQDIKNRIFEFCKRNKCIELNDEIFKFICSDEVQIFSQVNNEKKIFNYQLKSKLKEVNDIREKNNIEPITITSLDIGAIESKYYEYKVNECDWGKHITEAIKSVKGGIL